MDPGNPRCIPGWTTDPPHTSLDPLELTPPRANNPSLGADRIPIHASVSFRHSGWASRRRHVYASLQRIKASTSRLSAFQHCGERAWILRSRTEPNTYRVAASYCHDRFCQPCARAKAFRLAANIRDNIGTRRHRFVTLTLKQSNQPLANILDRLLHCFRLLRRSPRLRHCWQGGCAIVEVKRGQDRRFWNCHLHVIVNGTFLPHETLREEWKRITGDSFIVDVRRINEHADAARYVCKYVAKPIDSTAFTQHDWIDELLHATQRRRLLQTFGNWTGKPLNAMKSNPDDWQPLCTFEEAIRQARHGHPTYQHILNTIAKSWRGERDDHGNPLTPPFPVRGP